MTLFCATCCLKSADYNEAVTMYEGTVYCLSCLQIIIVTKQVGKQVANLFSKI